MLVFDMYVASRGIGLPDFNQGIGHRTTVAVEHVAGDNNSLALRLSFMLAGKVVIGFADLSMSIDRARNFRQGMRKINEWLRRRSF